MVVTAIMARTSSTMMASDTEHGEAAELTEKEWREMRRRMTSLQFEPVPETPELLPRSCYGGDDVKEHEEGEVELGERVAKSGGEGPISPARDVAMLESCVETEGIDPIDTVEEPERRPRTAQLSSTPRSSTKKPPKSPAARALPSSSLRKGTAPSPVKRMTKRPSSSSTKPSAADAVKLPSPAELNDLEATITSAQEQLRATIVAAVEEAMARRDRETTLAKKKIEASHANELALLHHQLEELQSQHEHSDRRALRDAQLIERLSCHLQQAKLREREVWRSAISVRACFHAWRHRSAEKKRRHQHESLAAAVSRSQAQKLVLQQWKLSTQQGAWAATRLAMEEQHRRELEELRAETSARVEQLQRELDEAKRDTRVAQDQRQQLEGDLRQVFLRGVSAMNLEALTLFRAKSVPSRITDELPSRGAECEESTGEVPPDQSTTGEHSAQAAEDENELASEERMIPVKPPAVPVEDPRVKFRPPAEGTAMPSYAMANMMLKSAGTPACELLPEVFSPPPPPPPPPTAAIHGLRSAELVEAHQRVQHAHQPSAGHQLFPLKPTGVSLSPVQQRLKTHSSTQFQVEMEYVKSNVASAVALSRYGASPSRSSVSARSSLSSRGSSPLVSAPTSRRSSTNSASSSSRWRVRS